MKAFLITEQGPAMGEAPKPAPKPGQVLVRVAANALNRADVYMSKGAMHGAHGGVGAILGSEWSGEVAELGAGVTGFALGDRVMGSGGGGFADYVAAPANHVLAIPDAKMDFETAACFPVALRTMHNAIVTTGELIPGGSVLIQGASTGVGILGLQIAKVLGAAKVVGSSTDPARRARLAEFGADLAIDSKDPDWVKAVLAFTDGLGVDLVVDQVSGPLINGNMRAAKILGRIVNVGRLGGDKGEFDADLHALRRISYIGVTFRTRTAEQVAEITRRMVADLWGPLTAGRLTMPIDSVFPFAETQDALDRMDRNAHFGKIVLRH